MSDAAEQVTEADDGAARKRRRRAVNPGPRSLDVLDWIVRVGCTPAEPVSIALGMSIWTLYPHLSRLEKAGLIERAPTLRGGPFLIFPTRRGFAQVDRPWVGEQRRTPAQWEHYRDVALTTAWLSTHPDCEWWRHEREFTDTEPPAGEPRGPDRWVIQYLTIDQRGRRVTRTRRPDLMAMLQGRLTAIEVERTVKGADRLDRIVGAWGGALQHQAVDRVLYVVPAPATPAEKAVRGSIERTKAIVSAITPSTMSVLDLDTIRERMEGRTVPAGSIGTGGSANAEPRPPRAHQLDPNED